MVLTLHQPPRWKKHAIVWERTADANEREEAVQREVLRECRASSIYMGCLFHTKRKNFKTATRKLAYGEMLKEMSGRGGGEGELLHIIRMAHSGAADGQVETTETGTLQRN